jgi:hypothetical protein
MSIIQAMGLFLEGLILSLKCITYYPPVFNVRFLQLILVAFPILVIGSSLMVRKEYPPYQSTMEYYISWFTLQIYYCFFPVDLPFLELTKERNNITSSLLLQQLPSTTLLPTFYTFLLFGGLGLPIITLSYCFGSVFTVKLLEKEIPLVYVDDSSSSSFERLLSTSSSSPSTTTGTTIIPPRNSSLHYTGTGTLTILINLLYRMLFFTVFNVFIYLLNSIITGIGTIIFILLSNVLYTFDQPQTIVISIITILTDSIRMYLWSYSYSVAIFDQVAVTKENYLQYLLTQNIIPSKTSSGNSTNNDDKIETITYYLHRYSLQYRSFIFDHQIHFLSGYSILPTLLLRYIYYRNEQSLLLTIFPKYHDNYNDEEENLLFGTDSTNNYWKMISVWYLHTVGNYIVCSVVYGLLYPLLCINAMQPGTEKRLYLPSNDSLMVRETKKKEKLHIFRILPWVHYGSRKVIEYVSTVLIRVRRR